MSDDLEAARARIAMLEAQLATAQAELTVLRGASRVPSPSPAPSTGALPGLWDHNRRFPKVSGGIVAGVVCPSCRAGGEESQMVRELGAGNAIAQERGYELEEVTCPRCLTTGWLRTR